MFYILTYTEEVLSPSTLWIKKLRLRGVEVTELLKSGLLEVS